MPVFCEASTLALAVAVRGSASCGLFHARQKHAEVSFRRCGIKEHKGQQKQQAFLGQLTALIYETVWKAELEVQEGVVKSVEA